MHILPNVWGGKGNQTKKFDLLIDCNARHSFLGKSYPKCGGEASPRPYS